MLDGDMTDYQPEFAGRELRRPRPQRLSAMFADLAQDVHGPVTIARIRDALGDRSLAALLFFFAAINLLPLPPGASAILGLPLIIVSAQMVYGAKTAWLPRFLLTKSFTADQFRNLTARLVPNLRRLERLVTPRYWPFWPQQGERVVGIIALVMAIAVTLPIPLGNWLPAFSAALVALALSERDGVLFSIGCAVGLMALAVIGFVVGSAGVMLHMMWTSLFG